jgi:hypothetical protein
VYSNGRPLEEGGGGGGGGGGEEEDVTGEFRSQYLEPFILFLTYEYTLVSNFVCTTLLL